MYTLFKLICCTCVAWLILSSSAVNLVLFSPMFGIWLYHAVTAFPITDSVKFKIMLIDIYYHMGYDSVKGGELQSNLNKLSRDMVKIILSIWL